jgi:hypothetical protein
MGPPPPSASLYSNGWDQQALAAQIQMLQLQQPPHPDWYFDTGATNHVTSDAGTLSSTAPPSSSTPSSIVVGDGSLVPSHPPAPLIFYIIFFLIMFYLLHTLLRTLFPSVSLPLTIIAVWNLILLVVL